MTFFTRSRSHHCVVFVVCVDDCEVPSVGQITEFPGLVPSSRVIIASVLVVSDASNAERWNVRGFFLLQLHELISATYSGTSLSHTPCSRSAMLPLDCRRCRRRRRNWQDRNTPGISPEWNLGRKKPGTRTSRTKPNLYGGKPPLMAFSLHKMIAYAGIGVGSMF